MQGEKYKKNIVFNSIYRIVVILAPLITSPYISRVLGADNIGIYSSSNALATYFVIFALLGVGDYGNRCISRVRDDKDQLSNTFWQIFYLQCFLTALSFVLYLVTVLFFINDHIYIRLILSLYVFSSFFEINWFAFGLEEFKLTSIRSIIVRILIVVSIFLFVKSSSDLWIYTIILTVGNFVSLLTIVPLIKKYTSFRSPNIKEIIKHLKPNLILFLPVIANSFYHQMDKIMLGFWSPESEVGYYQNAENIINLPMFLTTAIATVMMPHSANMIANGKVEQSNELARMSLKYTSILNIAMTLGLAAIAPSFVPWFLGSGYERSAELIVLLSAVIFVSGFSTILRYQYLIPTMRDKEFLISIISGAVVNLILNIVMIPSFGADGAAFATIIAYLTVCIIQIAFSIKTFNFIKIFLELLPFALIGFAMFFSVRFLVSAINSTVLSIIISICAGAIIYILLSVLTLLLMNDRVAKKYLKKILHKE